MGVHNQNPGLAPNWASFIRTYFQPSGQKWTLIFTNQPFWLFVVVVVVFQFIQYDVAIQQKCAVRFCLFVFSQQIHTKLEKLPLIENTLIKKHPKFQAFRVKCLVQSHQTLEGQSQNWKLRILERQLEDNGWWQAAHIVFLASQNPDGLPTPSGWLIKGPVLR